MRGRHPQDRQRKTAAMKKRVVLLPNTNTFSHVARALALADWRAADGWAG